MGAQPFDAKGSEGRVLTGADGCLACNEIKRSLNIIL